MQTEIRQMRSAGKVGRKLGKFSVRGGMSLALRRTAQNSPCASMGLVLCTDCSGQTVSIWELKLDAALRSSSKWHLSEFEAAIDALGGCSVSLIRSDCSNAKLWYTVSAHVAEYQSLYLVDPEVQGGKPDKFESRFIGDVQIADDKTGLGVRRMLIHQSRSIGYPTWIDYLAKRGLAPRTLIDGRPLAKLSDRLKEQLAQHRGERVINKLVQATDSGPDQLSCKHIIGLEVLPCIWIWHFNAVCMFHAGHIRVKDSLTVKVLVVALSLLVSASLPVY